MGFIRALAPAFAVCLALTGATSADPVARLDPRLADLVGPEAGTEPDRLRPAMPGQVGGPSGARHSKLLWPPDRATGAELACLTEALYHEARGEGVRGMRAVAEVVLNRVESPRFPGSICAVVHQGTRSDAACQFSYACDGSLGRVDEPRAMARAERIAREMAAGAPRALTDGATHFHTTAVNPPWATAYDLTAQIGVHRFYRRPVEVAAN